MEISVGTAFPPHRLDFIAITVLTNPFVLSNINFDTFAIVV